MPSSGDGTKGDRAAVEDRAFDRRAEGDLSGVFAKLTGEGAIALSTLAVFTVMALVMGDNLVFLMGSLILGGGIVCRRLTRTNLVGARVRRVVPARSRVGLPTTLTYELEAAGDRQAVGVEVADRPTRGIRPIAIYVEFPVSQRDEPIQATTHVRFTRRGRHTLENLWIRSRYPLGLFSARKFCRASSRILVHPAEGRITGRLRQRLRGRSRLTSRPTRLLSGDDLLYGVREYRDGDDPRRIHWRTTARRGALTISEWRSEVGNEVVLVLGRGQGAGPRAVANFERAVSCVATIWRAVLRDRLPGRLLWDDAVDPIASDDGHGVTRGLDVLAEVRSQGRRRPRATLEKLARAPGRRTIVYVASGPEAGLDKLLPAAAGRGGDWIVIRSDRKRLPRWVRGLR